MKRSSALTTRESGQVVVLFALLIPVMFALGAIVMDVGNWYVHKRHLQTQVDAAVLAAAPHFVGCFYDPTAANAAIASTALAYAGDTARDAAARNQQVQEPNDVRVVLNSSRYWQQADGLALGATGYTGVPDNTIATPGDPCSTRFIDAKATDDEAPPLWGLIPLNPSPKSKARVEIRDIESMNGMLPWAVPEIDPAAVAALFVNENTGASPVVFDSQLLIEQDDPALPWSEWVTPAGQEDVTLDGGHENTGVMILVSKDDATPIVTGTLSEICNQDPGLVACYGTGASQTSGLSFIHAYNGSRNGSISSPQVREVELTGGQCSTADLSAPYFVLDGGCSAVVQAVIDFGVDGDPRPLSAACATVNGYTWSSGGIGGVLGTWTGSVNLPVAGGRQTVNLGWSAGNREQGNSGNCANNQPNSGTLSKVAAPYVANTASGPVQFLDLTAQYANGNPVPDANSVELNDPGNTSYKYWVKVGLPKPHSVDNYTDPPVMLRMASPSGSQNQAWDCDSRIRFEEEIENGCRTYYTENYRDVDGDGDLEWNNLLCTGWNTTNLPPPTFGPGPPPYPSDCVITETGDKTGQLRDGLHLRLETPCYDNNWPDDAAEAASFFGPGGSVAGDPRYVTLIITDNTAFTGSGNEALPIKYFAGFYVTGWDYHQTQSPGCPDPDGPGPRKGNDDHPIYGPVGSYNATLDNGDVWGYFVDIVHFSGVGEPSDDLCTFGGDPAACIAVLVE